MKSIKLFLATAVFAISGAATAGPSYTYVDLGIVTGDSSDVTGCDTQCTDVPGGKTQGYSLRGSFGFADIFHVGGGYLGAEVDGGKAVGTTGADNTGYAIFFGVNPPVSENFDFVARLGYAASESEGFIGGNTPYKGENKGVYIQAGPRGVLGEKFELSAYVNLASGEVKSKSFDVKNEYSGVGFQVGAAYYFTPAMSLGLDVIVDGTVTPIADTNYRFIESAANVYFRYSFGNN